MMAATRQVGRGRRDNERKDGRVFPDNHLAKENSAVYGENQFRFIPLFSLNLTRREREL
jgi:hypothetical protein